MHPLTHEEVVAVGIFMLFSPVSALLAVTQRSLLPAPVRIRLNDLD